MYFDFTHLLFLIVMKMKLAPKNAFSFAAENNSALTLVTQRVPCNRCLERISIFPLSMSHDRNKKTRPYSCILTRLGLQ